MSNLKTYKFAQLYDMSSGISSKPEQFGHGFPFLSFSTVFKSHFLPEELRDLMDISDKEKEVYSIKEGDIFLTRTSETLDELGMSCVSYKDYPNASYSGFLKRLRPTQKDISYHKFMAFYLRSKLFRQTMNNNAVMTLRASLNEQIFSYLDLVLPPFEEQKKIGDFLFQVNQKIELNNKINAELEAMAKLIYDYWFVQFDFPISAEQATSMGKLQLEGKPYKSSGGKMVWNEELKREVPEGWEVKKLKDFAQTGSGATPLKSKPEYYLNGNIPWINSGEVNASFIVKAEKFITEEGINNSSAKLFKKGTILMAMYGATAGQVSLMDIEACTNQAICGINPHKKEMTAYLKFGLEDLYNYLISLSSGSARDNLSQDKIRELYFVIPKYEILFEFDRQADAMLRKILVNMKENQKLAELRDWLLPMLMNGQVKIDKLSDKDETLNKAAEERDKYK